MKKMITIRVSPSFEGTTTIRLERETYEGGRFLYYIIHDQSQSTGYRAGPDIRKYQIPPEVAEAIIKELESSQIGICPEEVMGCDGTTTEIEIERGFNKVSFTWWQELPKQWKNLSKVIELLNQPPESSPVAPQPLKAKLQVQGKPDGTYLFTDSEGKEREGWMPPELMTEILRQSGAQQLTPVLIREPSDEIREDFWPIDQDTVKRLGDTDGVVHVVSHLEDGEPSYNFVSKRVWDNYDQMIEIMADPTTSEPEKKARMEAILHGDPPTGSDDQAGPTSGKTKTLLEKAQDAPIAFRILVDTIQIAIERDHPQVLILPRWQAFQMAGTVAGCVALAIRLHFDVEEDQRTLLEMAMRKVLEQRFPKSEQAYEDCYRFVTDSMKDIPRAERGKYFFVLLGMWAYAAVSDGKKIEQEEWVVGRLAEALQNETIGFWESSE